VYFSVDKVEDYGRPDRTEAGGHAGRSRIEVNELKRTL
jgi:hypothetical protein